MNTLALELGARALYEHERAAHPDILRWPWESPQVQTTGAHEMWLERVRVVLEAVKGVAA